jgi:hypothetical protein
MESRAEVSAVASVALIEPVETPCWIRSSMRERPPPPGGGGGGRIAGGVVDEIEVMAGPSNAVCGQIAHAIRKGVFT